MAGPNREAFLTARVTPNMRREASLLAKARGVSRSELVRTLLRREIQAETAPTTRDARQPRNGRE